MKGHPINWTAQERAWIKARCTLPRAEMHRQFVATFDRPDVTKAAISGLCKRNGWMTGRTGNFERDQRSWNKGKKMPYHPNSAATQFKAGVLQGRAAEIIQPIGAIRTSKEGYLQIKINNDLPFYKRWRGLHLVNWEKVNGPLPKGHALKCLDGNRQNTDAANWIAIPRALLPRLGGRFGRDYDSAPAELKPAILAIAELEHAARSAKARP